jgi:hypothetical protein
MQGAWLMKIYRSLAALGTLVLLGAGILQVAYWAGRESGSAQAQAPTPAGARRLAQKSSPTARPSEKSSAEPKEPCADWPKPEVVLVFSGQQMGYIEPCGCTGLANQKGGLARRHTFLKQLAARGWDVVPLDVGNQVRKFGKQQEIKFSRTADALRIMKYRGVTFGEADLRLPAGEVFAAANPDASVPSIFLSSNVALLDRELTPRAQVVTVAGHKIGVTGVLGGSFEKLLQQEGELFHKPPLEMKDALPDAAKELASQKCEVQVLLAHASLEESKQLAQKFPQFQLVATAGGVGEPPFELERIAGTNSYLIEVGHKGMYVAVVGLYDDPKRPIRYERVALDDRFEDSPEMRKVMAEYQNQLKSLRLTGLGLTSQPHPQGKRFVGSEKCGECHTKAFAIWKDTPHAHATDSLVHPKERGDVARHFDPECLSCHVTGWDPQKVFPFNSGYMSLEATPHLQHNGCENCHGPGSAHVAAESGELKVSAADLANLRAGMRLTLAGGAAEKKCLECHDLDNSPDFHVKGAFEKYWKQVEHKGKD